MNSNPQDDPANTPGQNPQYSPQPPQQPSSWQTPAQQPAGQSQFQQSPQPQYTSQNDATQGFQPSQWPQLSGTQATNPDSYSSSVAQGAPLYDPTPGVAPSALANPLAPVPVERSSKKWLIIAIIFILTTLVALGGGAWAMINYLDQRDNVDTKVSVAVSAAVKEQADKDAAAFLEKEKQPYRLFAGPDDYGSLTLEYPKTWSLHVASDASKGGTYAAYLNPVSVPPIVNAERYGLRVSIEEKDYDRVLETYKNLVSSGELQSSSFQLDADTTGTRLDGNFTKDIRGSAVIFKIRDKTVTLRTDAETFKQDFDTLIKTIEFNK